MDWRPKCKIRNYKTLREKHRQNTLGVNHRKILYDSPPRAMEIETKLKWELIKLKSFFHRKGNYKLYEKTTLRMGKKELHMKQLTKDLSPKYTNNSYSSIQEKQQPNQTVGKRPKQTFLQRRHTDC